jgi:uncharacterized protein with PIN domain
MLRVDGHDVLTVGEAGAIGIPDASVIELARAQQRILLTRNCDDFLTIHQANSEHSGILAVYQDADPRKNMSYVAIVKAIANLQDTGLCLQGQFIVLNRYYW